MGPVFLGPFPEDAEKKTWLLFFFLHVSSF
jgi:hypothetical protein